MNKKARGSMLLMLLAMLIFGTVGLLRRYIPLPSGVVAMARGYIGLLTLLLYMLVAKKRISFSAVRKNLVRLIISGAVLGFNWIFLFEAYNYTSVAAATLCYYMAPVIVILVSPLIFGEKLSVRKLCCAAVAVTGIVLVSGIIHTGFSGGVEFTGIILALVAAVLYAGVVLINKKTAEIDACDKSVFQLGIAGTVLIPYNFLTVKAGDCDFSPRYIFLLLVLGVVHTGIAYVLYFGSMKRLRANTVAFLSFVDPAVAVMLSAFVLRESIGVTGWIGAVMVLGAVLVSEI